MSSEFFANLNDLNLPKSDPAQDKNVHLSDFNVLLDQNIRDPDTSFKNEMHTAFRAMLDDISPAQKKVEDMEPEDGPCEHMGFFEPEIINNDTYHRLVQSIKDSPHWVYSGPNRIEPCQEGLVDKEQLQDILDQYTYEDGDFFRGSITIWGALEHNTGNRLYPNRLEIYYIDREDNRFVLKHKVLR